MPAFKPAYLIHGDDHGRIAERRARLRTLAEPESGPQGVEVFEGEEATPARVAAALDAMTFALGRRFVIVDGVERWSERELDPLLRSLEHLPPETTVAFFAREDGRAKAPKKLHEAVRRAGGAIDAENAVKPWELPRWALARGRELGLELDAEGTSALVRRVGERQQRLLRELEKLALWAGAAPGGRTSIAAADVEAVCAPSAERRAWTLADALVAGDGAAAVRLYFGLRAQGERLGGLLYWMAQRLRTAHELALALEKGESAAALRRSLRMPPKAAERLLEDARRAGSERLRTALCVLADLELAARGGGPGGAAEESAMLLAISRIAA